MTFVCTLGLAPRLDEGILIAAVLAVGMYLYRTMRPRVATLGRAEYGAFYGRNIYDDLVEDEDIILLRFFGHVHLYAPAYSEAEFPALVEISGRITFNSISQWERFAEQASSRVAR